jgi:hypothetical protein
MLCPRRDEGRVEDNSALPRDYESEPIDCLEDGVERAVSSEVRVEVDAAMSKENLVSCNVRLAGHSRFGEQFIAIH